MALLIYIDEATTTQALPNEVFSSEVTGSEVNFPLAVLDGEQVNSVYHETKVEYTGVTFSAGVSSALSGAAFNTDELVGKRVIHNGEFRGTVVSNTSNTITISGSYTQATASNCGISTYTKKRLTTDYSIQGNTVVFVNPPAVGRLHIVPAQDAGLAFGGNPDDQVTTVGSVWLKREPGFEYRNVKVYSQDNSVDDVVFTQAGVTSAAGVMSGFSGLTINALAGYAVWHNGAYRGTVTSNTATTVTISDSGYTQASTYDAQLFNVGSALVSLDGETYAAVVSPADITTDTPVRVYFRDTVTIPDAPMNYPNVILKATGVEYLAA